MRYAVLAALRMHGSDVSGETLSRQLGISRVAVWKQVRELRKQGYDVAASAKGYRLESTPDALLPGEFPGWESLVHHVETVDSTMRLARALARRGAENGTLVIAERQTAGRGRLDRSWVSPAGGIYMTLVTRPAVAPALAPRISLMASVAVAEAIESLYGLPARVKWPNDVLISDRKVCGECDVVRYVNVGVGLNANAVVGEIQTGAVSLAELLGAPVDRKRLVRAVVEGVLARLSLLGDASTLDEWRRRAVTIGREVSIAGGREPVVGTALDIDSTGALLVRQADGSVTLVVAGDCTHRDS
jgi:BirA family biotin operon repressor/biotin-[acetyl-CoA-carboxylase] ligase